jgi:preprotein translocase subunit Sss1
MGLLIMGGLGYVVKLLHYPVKEILVGKMAS